MYTVYSTVCNNCVTLSQHVEYKDLETEGNYGILPTFYTCASLVLTCFLEKGLLSRDFTQPPREWRFNQALLLKPPVWVHYGFKKMDKTFAVNSARFI